jgi:phosphoribosyl 1,2-cyclic phosphodiesterase
MSIEVCVLASGSMGNCSIVRTPAGVVLIDAGIGPRTTARRLDGTGVRVRDIRAICLTHLDSDHFRPSWLGTILNHGIKIFCHRSRAQDVLDILDHDAAEPLIQVFDDQRFHPLDGLSVRAIPLAHDRTGSHGFVLDGFHCRIGWATDLGRVPRELHEHFVNLDLLALESNYDPEMQLRSARPWFLKNRIMGGAGHLSNEQAYEAICRILDRCQRKRRRLPHHIVLLHRSRECNCPKLLRKMFERDERIASRLTLADQFQRSNWLRIRPTPPIVGEQLALAFA